MAYGFGHPSQWGHQLPIPNAVLAPLQPTARPSTVSPLLLPPPNKALGVPHYVGSQSLAEYKSPWPSERLAQSHRQDGLNAWSPVAHPSSRQAHDRDGITHGSVVDHRIISPPHSYSHDPRKTQEVAPTHSLYPPFGPGGGYALSENSRLQPIQSPHDDKAHDNAPSTEQEAVTSPDHLEFHPCLISRPLRVRIRYSCHECQNSFQPKESNCSACGHERCKDCPRNPPRRVATEAVILPQDSLPTRPKLELNSSFPYLPPCKEEDYAIATSEPSRISDELTKYFTYYCSVAGCIHSASPELCDLDSRNAKTIYDGETHKVYVLNGLSEADLIAHIFEAHKIAIEDSRHLVDLSAYKHTPLVAEERRFIVPSVTNPDASGWLMRTRLGGHAWSDWKGLDYDIVVASGFRSWDCKNCPCKSQLKPSNACTDTAIDEGIDCTFKSNTPVDVLHREIGGSLEGPAELPVNIPAGETRHTVDSAEQLNLHNIAKSRSCPDGQPPAPTSLMSSEVDHGSSACTEGSALSISDDGSLSPQETNSNEDIDSDVSITGRTKRRVLENIMNEVQTMLSGNFSGTLRCRSEGSESTSSSEVVKPSSSFEQTSQTQSSISAGKKRGQDYDPISEDEDDSSQKRRKKPISASSMTARARLLACPFNKHEPKTYGPYNDDKAMARKFKRCSGPGWDDLPRLKEHLYRVHAAPIECSRCWLSLKTEKDLADHVRKQTPCEVQPQLVEWIPREKIKVLKDRKKALLGQSERERWEYVYRVLFPEEPNLPSPYYDELEHRFQDDTSLSSSSRDHAAFEQYLRNNLYSRVENAIEARLDEQMLPIQESLKRVLAEIIHECQAQLFREWETKGKSSTQTLEMDDATGQVSHGEPSLPEPKSRDESLSVFYIEPEPAIFENAFDGPLQFKYNGEGPSRAITDSGYNSLPPNSDIIPSEPLEIPTLPPDTDTENTCALQQDLEDALLAELDLRTDFDWSDYLVETGSGPTSKP